MNATCAHCGKGFPAVRSTAQYCGAKCRKLAAEYRKRKPLVRLAPPPLEVPEVSGIAAAMNATFTQDLLDSPRGQAALRLASDIDTAPSERPGLAALMREMRSLLDELEAKQAPRKANPLTLIRERHVNGRAAGE